MELIFKTNFGSHLYGTNTPTSDRDVKGVYLPTAREIILQRIKPVYTTHTKENMLLKNEAGDEDYEYFSLDKYLKLLSEGQTVAIDLLFATNTKNQHVSSPSPLWQYIYDNRLKIINKKCASFLGYCRQQANKYGIKGSRLNAARKALEFLKEQVEASPGGHLAKIGEIPYLEQLLGDIEFIQFIDIEIRRGVFMRHLDVCNRKVPFHFTIKEAIKIYQNLFDEYGKRASLAETNQGVDWKALSHAVRIGEEAIELFETGEVLFPRPNAKELTLIKQGEKSYVEVATRIEALFPMVEAASAKSTLREESDKEFIDDLIFNAYEGIILGYHLKSSIFMEYTDD